MMPQNENSPPIHVAYLGPEASFSHQAAIEAFRISSTSPSARYILHPSPSFRAIFSAVQQSGSQIDNLPARTSALSTTPSASSRTNDSDQTEIIDYAIIPVENSTNGSVVQVLDLLAQCGLMPDAAYPDLEVVGEHYLSVHHCLYISQNSQSVATNDSINSQIPSLSTSTQAAFASSPSSRNAAIDVETISKITILYTHPQVWGQCSSFLSRYLTRAERIDMSSTSAAAKFVSKISSTTDTETGGLAAAISSKLAGEMDGMTRLAGNIEDDPEGNTTRFFIVRNRNRNRNRKDRYEDVQGQNHNQNQAGTQNASLDRGRDDQTFSSQTPSTSTTAATTSNTTTSNPTLTTTTKPPHPDPNPSPLQTSIHPTEIPPSSHPISHPKKSLITFTIPHHSPGSLARALQTFGQHGFNLRTINTRPVPPTSLGTRIPWQYVFFVECEDIPTRRHTRSQRDEYQMEKERPGWRLDKLLADLTRGHCERLRLLGSWC